MEARFPASEKRFVAWVRAKLDSCGGDKGATLCSWREKGRGRWLCVWQEG